MIKVRFANIKDVNTIATFNSAMAMETEGKTLDNDTVLNGVTSIFNDKSKGFYVIAKSDDAPVGQLMITKEWSDWRNGDFWWIQSVYVDANYRNNKIFRKLYNFVIGKAKADPTVRGIRLYVDKDNKRAQQVYSKLGMGESNYIFYEEDWSNV